VTVLTFANVPTGINLGVLTTPCGVWNCPTLASVWQHWHSNLKVKLFRAYNPKLICKFKQPVIISHNHLDWNIKFNIYDKNKIYTNKYIYFIQLNKNLLKLIYGKLKYHSLYKTYQQILCL